MDGVCYNKSALLDPSIYLSNMDNDSGYVSNNLDQESNSDSVLDNSDTSTVNILRSFLPKPIYLSEDALLERPHIDENEETVEDSPNIWIESSVKSEKTYLSFSSLQTESDISDSSIVVPVTDPIYFNLNTNIHSSPMNFEQLEDCSNENIKELQNEDRSEGIENKSNIISAEILKNDIGIKDKQMNAVNLGQFSSEIVQSTVKPIPFLSEKVRDLSSITNEVNGFTTMSFPIMTNPPQLKLKESYSYFDNNISQVSGSSEFSSDSQKARANTPRKIHNSFEINIFSNVTNICDKTEKMTSSSENFNKVNVKKCMHSSKDKENISQPLIFKTPSKGQKRKLNTSASPDLFSDDESNKLFPIPSPKMIEERFLHNLDYKLLKRVQKELSGVPPPPDFTVTKFTVDDILQKLNENKSYFWTEELKNGENISVKDASRLSDSSFGLNGSILIKGSFDEAINKKFPDILYSRHHGLHHNRNKLSEEIEYLCEKYAKRYIGAETQSTCCAVDTKYISPTKRKAMKQKWAAKSPGRRLSHLARRRITFSSANLQASSSSSAASRARQILIDYKKLELLNHKRSPRKSPRKTPRKSPNKSPSQGRTPSSSAKKKLRLRFRLLSGDFKEDVPGPSTSIAGSKRALFQSPDNENKFKNILSNSSTSSCSSFNSDLNSRGTKRSLFPSPSKIGYRASLFSSPNKKSPFENVSLFEKKRKRDEKDDGISNPSKFFRSQSTDIRSLENNENESLLPRTKSDILPSSQPLIDLSAAHKKKLQWAVYESLKLQNISTSHPQFKVYASVLARVTRRFILASNVRLEGGTSEKMLRIARHHSFAVVKGKSVEEIMSEYNRNKAKSSKPQGYIAPEDYQRTLNRESSVGKESALRDRSNTGDSIRNSNARAIVAKPESRIDRIRKVINFEENR
ncbi:hypothetical protein HHI36_001701 [Cryptolaemus montrouzieri]|uniref:Uncharacterized protein n=1 Tax=Cryptolaemus montrouzieri TaxID=559131 RepID=A0ABD2P886_9CUCU